MKQLIYLGLLVALVGWSGCGKAPREEKIEAQAEVVVGVAGTPEAPREVRIEVGDHMKFSVTRFEAAAGETLRLVLVNTGSAPKEAMGHNWVLLKAGADAAGFANAAVGARATDYIPAGRQGEVVAHTKLIGGKARDAVVFTVPVDAASGTELVYLCTFPAHLQLGMRGVLVVK